MKWILKALGVAAVWGALAATSGCSRSSTDDELPVGPPPPDLPKTPAEYEASAPRQKI